MTFRVSLLFQADAKAAKAEVEGLATSARKVGEAAQDMGRKSADAARGVGSLSGAADGAEAQLRGMAAAQDVAAASQTKLARSTTMAAGATGSLVAQFNDIGMMLAAGQNPLQLAIQQGTQITQVIGPMGAAGAARALGAAFVGMLSPINLITIGAIAAGGAIIQWLTSAREPAITLQERIDDLSAAVAAYRDASALAAAGTDELVARFGGAAGKAGEVATILESWARVDAVRALDAAVDDITQSFGGLSDSLTVTTGGIVQEIDATFFELRDNLRLTDLQAATVVDALRDLAEAPTVGAQVEAAIALNEAFIRVFGSIEEIPAELSAVARQAAMIALRAAEMEGGMDGATDSAGRLSGALRTVADYAIDAQTAIATLAGIEPDAGWLGHAIYNASALAQQLWNAVGAMQAYRMDATGPLPVGGPGTFPAAGLPADAAPPGRPEARPTDIDFGFVPPPTVGGGGRGGGRGGGAGAARAERDAVGELIEKLQEELDILRETDPVQQELIRQRETLAGATEAERAEVTALIAAREAERQASEATAEMWDYLAQTAESSLMGIATGAQSVEEAARNAAAALAEAVLQAALFGQGPFGGLFGGTSILGDLGDLLGFARGGMIHGPGDGTADRVPILGSAGEFIVTAAATQRYRPVLEAMNAGAPLPRYAAGGMIGGEGGRGGKTGGGGETTFVIDVRGARGNREIENMVSDAVSLALRIYDRDVFPQSFRRVFGDPARVG
jgi:hypothetical protein